MTGDLIRSHSRVVGRKSDLEGQKVMGEELEM